MASRHRILVVQASGRQSSVACADRLTIGRSAQNGLVIEDSRASRFHAEIHRDHRGRHRIYDLGSSNGTWVNGKRVAVPAELDHGDQISIGDAKLTFLVDEAETGEAADAGTAQPSTALSFRHESVVILVSDVRDYTRMSEALGGSAFSHLISDWFRQSSQVIEAHGGIVDKFIGDAVMAYWIVRDAATAVSCALEAACETLDLCGAFDRRLRQRFPGERFRVGIGINLGAAMVGNVGGRANPSHTLVGDCVNVAFRLEKLSKEKQSPVVVSEGVAACAPERFRFADLGIACLEGRKEPVGLFALQP